MLALSKIMRRTGKSKTCVWRWQERFAEEGFEGLLRDKTRPSRIPLAPMSPHAWWRSRSKTRRRDDALDGRHDGET